MTFSQNSLIMVENQIAVSKSRFKNLLDNKTNLVFFIVPILLFIYMLFRLAEIHLFYQSWYDPVYSYLINGLTFALGSNDIGSVDHPGTPLQLICALIIKLVALFRGSDDLAKDVLSNPESYIRVIVISLIAINCLMIWMLGLFAYKNLNNKNLAILIQLLPLLSFELVKFTPIVACEPIVIFSSIAIAAFIILADGAKAVNKWLFIFIAFFSALSVSTKISSLVILIVPFFYFEKTKHKAFYLLLSFLFIFLFISPVIDKMGNFVNFIKGIATHTGNYGSGEEKIIDWSIYFQSLYKILFKELTFSLHLLLLPVGWFVIWKHKIDGSLKRLYVAITIATIFQVMVVARHYSFHYLMPIFALCLPLHGFFWIKFFQQKIGFISTKIVLLVTIILVTGVFARLIIKNRFDKDLVNPVEETSQIVNSKLKGNYIILTGFYNGSAFIEPALRFGCGYSGSIIRERYIHLLDSIYPGNYIWNDSGGFTRWSGSCLPTEVFFHNNEIFMYERAVNCETAMMKISEMVDKVGFSEFIKLKKVYQNNRSGETIALVTIDTANIRQLSKPKLIIETGMEELTPDREKFKSTNQVYTFNGGQLRSSLFARNGLYSLLLSPSKPYGLDISIPVSAGKHYKAEFWQRGAAQKQAYIVASTSKGDNFYRTSNAGENQLGEWTLTELAISLPEDYPEERINFYLWNPHTDSVWVDDFSLKVFE